MTETSKQKLSGPLGIPVVLLLEALTFFAVMAIFLVEGGWILIAEVVAGAAILVLLNRAPGFGRQ